MHEWFALLHDALSALPGPEGIEEWLSGSGLQRSELHTLVIAYLSQPSFTFDTLADWRPYAAPGLLNTQLDAVLDKDFVQAEEPQAYRLTEKGLELIRIWSERVRAHLAGLTPLSARDLRRLSALLSHIVQAVFDAPSPPSKDRLLGSRRIAPAAGAAPMVHIDQYLTDLVHFRDDAHVSAWRQHGFDGPSIEVLTLLWRGEAENVDGISAALSEQRGFAHDHYVGVVKGLQERGLLEASQETLAVTDEGRALREEIEATTDRYYMFAWTALSPVDVQELRNLLQRLTQALGDS
jgi:DNA-binding MarR family transcriptional regulator